MEGIMFRENLLESAPAGRKRTRWSMAIAFTLELIVVGLLIVLPVLFSSGAISAQHVIACPQIELQPDRVTIVDDNAATGPRGSSVHGSPATHPAVVTLAGNTSLITIGPPSTESGDPTQPPTIGGGTDPAMPGCEACSPTAKPGLQPPVRVSVISEGQLLNKVEPIYPKIASLTGIRGEVRLYAIIAKDGTIQSLRVISGHPLLTNAALDAVRQWRYRPYVLNKEPVEVETFITVNFRNGR
jgi:protein TonB